MKAIKCGVLIDGKGGEPIHKAVILLENDKIKAVGAASQVSIPDDAEVLDLSDKTVLPGMIDCHVHINSNGEPATELRNLKDLMLHKARWH